LGKLLDKARTLFAVALEDEDAAAHTNGATQLSSAMADAKVQPTMNLLESKHAMLEQCIKAHETKEVSLVGDSSKLAADWQNRKIALEEELLRAKLQMKTINTEVSAFERVNRC